MNDILRVLNSEDKTKLLDIRKKIIRAEKLFMKTKSVDHWNMIQELKKRESALLKVNQ